MTAHRRRGSTMLEVLIASVVLIIGLTAIVELVLAGVRQFRDASVQQTAQQHVTSALSDYATIPYATCPTACSVAANWTNSFTAGVTNIGDITDNDGRVYSRLATITDIGDGGGVGAFLVQVDVGWNRTGLGAPVPTTSTGYVIISETPDAGTI